MRSAAEGGQRHAAAVSRYLSDVFAGVLLHHRRLYVEWSRYLAERQVSNSTASTSEQRRPFQSLDSLELPNHVGGFVPSISAPVSQHR